MIEGAWLGLVMVSLSEDARGLREKWHLGGWLGKVGLCLVAAVRVKMACHEPFDSLWSLRAPFDSRQNGLP